MQRITDIPTVDILGFPIANVDMKEAVEAVANLLGKRERAGGAGAAGAGTADAGPADAGSADAADGSGAAGSNYCGLSGARIVTANAEILYHGYSDPALGGLLKGADLIVPDGVGAVKAAAMLGSPLKGRVAGGELLLELSAWAAANGRGVYLLGAAREAAAGAAAALQKKYPALKITGYHDGYFDEEEKEAILREIQEKRPDFLFVAMGFPAQDLFFENHKDRLPVGVMMGVGGFFDVLSGRVRRAPLWIQKINLEWAYRFAQNPKRLGRIWALPRFILAVRRQKTNMTGKS